MRLINLGVMLSGLMLMAIGVAAYALNLLVFGLATGVTLAFQVGAIVCFLMDKSTPSIEGSEDREVLRENEKPIDLMFR